MKRLLSSVPFLLILALGIYLRFDRLTVIPPSLSHDETAIAYNAYSLLKTGKDEYGVPFPLLFRSFDDYKLPGMVYATVPWVAIFGKSELAARMPSALFGVLAVIVIYAIAKEVLGGSQFIPIGKRKLDAALIPMLVLAVQPWHINFSRQLFESNGATFFLMLGIYFMLKSTTAYPHILWSGLSFVAALYFYYSVRLVIPFILLVYLISFHKTIFRERRTTLVTFAVCLLLFLPLGKEMLSPGGMERISIVSVVNDPNYHKLREEYIRNMGSNPTIADKIIYNRRVALLKTAIDNYLKNISPDNLFVRGTGTYGALYPFEMLLIPMGLLFLLVLPRFAACTILVWLVTAFLPGAFSVNQPNTLRTLVAAPAFALISGFGLSYLVARIARRRGYQVPLFFAAAILATLVSHEYPRFLRAYFIDNPLNNSVSFGDGYKQMVEYVEAREAAYDRIVISGYYWRPYIFLLYWGDTDPSWYQKHGSRDRFGTYEFTSASWDTSGTKLMDPTFDADRLSNGKKTLYILSPAEMLVQQKHFREISAINGRNEERVFIAAVEQ